MTRVIFPIHGCYKAITRNFDKDGDVDIMAISYFPDYKDQPQESIVYLVNKGNFEFLPYTVREFNSGNWITMDAADLDSDGDDDVVLGSLMLISSLWKMKFTSKQKDKPAILLLLIKHHGIEVLMVETNSGKKKISNL